MSDSANRECYMLVFNIGKKKNFGDILRSASAFGVKEVFIVGAKKLSTFGNQGTAKYCKYTFYDSLSEAKSELRKRNIRLIGIEITETAVPIQMHPFTGPTCFMAGNEGTGMNQHQLDACDSFVYIPQYSGATASLNVATATGIVFHYFALWANKPQQPREGFKFVVDPPPSHMHPSEEMIREAEEKRALRQASAKKLVEGHDSDGTQSDT